MNGVIKRRNESIPYSTNISGKLLNQLLSVATEMFSLFIKCDIYSSSYR